jgi:hypothetical protein
MTEEFGSSEAGKKGGRARAKNLTKDQRQLIAKRAAAVRWAGNNPGGKGGIPVATHGSADKPLRIGEVEIPCYVLDDGRRIVAQAGMITALGMVKGGSSHKGGTRLAKFVGQERVKPFCREGLVDVTSVPITFITPSGTIALGFEATILADICDAVLEARKAGTLTGRQSHIAARCEILMRSFARVGIIALVDEATGYQRERARDELAKILEAFVAKEIQKWVKTFDLEFYELICELRNMPLARAKKRPKYFGLWTNNLVYCRIAPGVLEELKKLSPADEKGNRKTKLFQGLTPDIGHPKLKEHLAGVTTAMKFARIQGLDWDQFIAMLDKTHPKFKPMPLLKGIEDDKGDVIDA